MIFIKKIQLYVKIQNFMNLQKKYIYSKKRLEKYKLFLTYRYPKIKKLTFVRYSKTKNDIKFWFPSMNLSHASPILRISHS